MSNHKNNRISFHRIVLIFSGYLFICSALATTPDTKDVDVNKLQEEIKNKQLDNVNVDDGNQ